MKICIIGQRGHYNYIFDDYAKIKELNILGISAGCEDDITPLATKCKSVGARAVIYADYKKMLDEQKPDAVVINGPFHLHAQMCIESIERGFHVFCEKPVSLTLADLDRLEAVHSRFDHLLITSMVGLRYEPCFMTAWKTVQEGCIGKVKLINANKSYKLGTRPNYFKSRINYGGTIPWVGSHALDWIYWFSGSDFFSVMASHTSQDNFGHDELEIAALCLFKMKNGVQASASIDYLRPMSALTHGDDRIRIVGTEGVIEVIGGKVNLIDAIGPRELVPLVNNGVFYDFVEHVQGTNRVQLNSHDTFRLTRACLLARESADTATLVYF